MLILLAIGFLAGVVTAVSPCVLPVLPILLAGGASGRKPLRIVAGLVVSFSVFTLFAAWLLDQLDLPDDFLRNAAIVLLLVMAVTLLVPRAGLLIERPLAVFSRFRPTGVGGGSCRAPAQCSRRSRSSQRTTPSDCAPSSSRSRTPPAPRCRCS
jgi:cytochrome c biogenesis protein CcdA